MVRRFGSSFRHRELLGGALAGLGPAPQLSAQAAGALGNRRHSERRAGFERHGLSDDETAAIIDHRKAQGAVVDGQLDSDELGRPVSAGVADRLLDDSVDVHAIVLRQLEGARVGADRRFDPYADPGVRELLDAGGQVTVARSPSRSSAG